MKGSCTCKWSLTASSVMQSWDFFIVSEVCFHIITSLKLGSIACSDSTGIDFFSSLEVLKIMGCLRFDGMQYLKSF